MKRTALIFYLIAAALSVRAGYETLPIETDESMGEFIRFESRTWAAEMSGEGGRLAANATWTGEHVILNDVYVPSGVTLTLGPGAKVKFCSGTRIKVEDGGAIVLNGAEGEEVVLTGFADDTTFAGIVLQSNSASYSDNGYVVADGFAFGKFATVSLSDTTAFVAGGQAIIPVSVSGSRDSAFSFDWVAETNGVAFASGSMSWSRVGDGTKNIVLPFDSASFATLSNFTVRASLLRCCNASKPTSIVTLSEFITYDIQTDEAMGDFIRFESREWTTDFDDMPNAEGGRLTANTVWSNEHVIVSSVYIPSGVTLTLTADTVVRFCEGTMIKIEDGGKLEIVGADGHDVILRGYEDDTKYTGIVKMSSGTLTDNSYVRVDGFTLGTLANVALNDSDTFRTSGLALIPVTVSGSRDNAFSIDWVAETNGAPYKTGTMVWSRVSDGTKNISINYGSELEGLDRFTVRVAVHRACYAKPDVCEVKIRDFTVADIQTDEAMGDFIRFESRDWTTNFTDVANTEGGRLVANTIWTGEHVILSDVYIPSGVTLTLGADALVRFCEGTMIKIEDGGKLDIVGAAGHDVIIRNYDGGTTSRGIVKMSSGTYTDNMYVQYPDFRYGSYPDIMLNDAGVGRDVGKIYVPITIGGSSRSQSFNVDWETDKGASGTVTWSQSGDGTKWVEIPVSPETFGGTEMYEIRLTAARGANLSVAKAKITIYEFNHPVTEIVSVTEGAEPSNEFAVHGEIKFQPIFLNATEELRYSGRWQNKLDPESVISRISVESDNGIVRLGEWPGTEEGAIMLNLADYNVGYYTLKHEIIAPETRKVLDTVTKSFSVADEDDVVMHGGTLTQNETWKAGKTHVVYETVVVPSIYTLFIEPGAIVKFMTGTGIDISQGGALFANAIIFTHIDDDTIGGDTLSDGYTVAPSMDSYALNGNFTFGADMELRYITQALALSGTIGERKVLSRGSTYRVTGTVTIASGGSLTIPSGTVLKLADKAAIVVNSGGALYAPGTRAAPITITSVNDDSISGKTEGSNSNPQPGDWDEIRNNGGTIEMSNVTLLYGGYGQYSNQGDAMVRTSSGTTRLDGCVVAHTNLRLLGRTGGTMSAVNCVLMDGWWGIDGAVGFVNGVISECLVGSNGGSVTNTVYYNCDTYSQSSKVGHCVAYGEIDVVQSGMVYADPLFVDPDVGDFRVVEGSPCVDAADGALAPAKDLYGQPRLSLIATDKVKGTPMPDGSFADIGVCEVMPRSVASDIDMEARSVRSETNAVPGQLLFVKWEVRNVGGTEVNMPWRDTISLVSADGGQEITLGDKETSNVISVGGIAFCSGYFTVPAIAEGRWYPKVNVNSYRDIFEGALTTNNVLVGETAVVVESEAIDAIEDFDGTIIGGSPEILKLAFNDENVNRMVRLYVPEGVVVRWGFGFMPSASRSAGSAIGTGADILFKVPDEATTVYVSLESDSNATFEMSFEDGKVAITGVSPNTLPSSGEVTITIDGAGFTTGSEVLLSDGTNEIIPESVQYVSSEQLVVTVDCGQLSAGAQYDVSVVGTENVATLESAVSVSSAKGEGRLEAKLILPDVARQGRAVLGYVEYSNTGTADMNVPIFIIKGSNNGTLVGPTSDSSTMTNRLKLVGISGSYPAGRLKVGETMRLPFYCYVKGTYAVELSIVDEESPLVRESMFSTWTSFCRGVADATTRMNGIEPNLYDYERIFANAQRAAYGLGCQSIIGRVVNEITGEACAGVPLSLYEKDRTYVAKTMTDADGSFRFDNLSTNTTYRILSAVMQLGAEGIEAGALDGCALLLGAAEFAEVKCRLEGNFTGGVRVFAVDEDGAAYEMTGEKGSYSAKGLYDGVYSINAVFDGYYCQDSAVAVEVLGGVMTNQTPVVRSVECGRLQATLLDSDTRQVVTNVEILVQRQDGDFEVMVTTDAEGGIQLPLPGGSYILQASNGYVFTDEVIVTVVNGETIVKSLEVKRVPFFATKPMGAIGLTTEFRLAWTNDMKRIVGCCWDFEADGIYDADGLVSAHTYQSAGNFPVRAKIIFADGTDREFTGINVVEVWEKDVCEKADGVIDINAASGWEVVSFETDSMTVHMTGDTFAIALVPGDVVIDPAHPAQPCRIVAIEKIDVDTIRLEVVAVEIVSAYKLLKLSTKSVLDDLKDKVIDESDRWHFAETVVKVGCLEATVAAASVDFNFGLVVDSGKLRRMYMDVDIPETDVEIKLAAGMGGDPKNKHGDSGTVIRDKRRRSYRNSKVSKSMYTLATATGAVGVVPFRWSVNFEWELAGEATIPIRINANCRVEYRRGAGVSKTTSFNGRIVPGGSQLEADVYAKAGLKLVAGVGVGVDKNADRYGASIFDLEVGAGVKFEAGMEMSFDEYSADNYYARYGAYLTVDAYLLRAQWKWIDLSAIHKNWEWLLPIGGTSWITPMPNFAIVERDPHTCYPTVEMKSTTVHHQEDPLLSRTWFRDGVAIGSSETVEHQFHVEAMDCVTVDFKLSEVYRNPVYDFLGLESVQTAKSVLKELQIKGPKEEGEDPEIELVHKKGEVPTSYDPNEMGGIMGRGDGDTQRYVKPGEWMTYTVYFENKSTATAAAQEVKVSNPLSLYLDWSTFEMGEVAFNNQIDLGLSGKQNGTSEVTMNGTSYQVRSKVTLDKTEGNVDWYLRIVDPSTPTTWPDDVFAGFLPPNDATYRGEGHLTYRIKVRDDAPGGVKITNAASIIFDYNDPIETDPAWWNQVAKVVSVEGSDGKAIKVAVDPVWIKTYVGESATDAEVAAALNATGANGLKVWTSVALGLDPENPDDKFLVDVPQNADENSVVIKALGGDLPTNAWMAIQYRLDRDATGGGETSSGTAQSGQGFSIDIGGAADPTGIYQVKAVLSDDEGTSATEVPAANQIGILRKTAANKREIVPVPWTKFAAGAEDIAVSNLVKTAGLTAGDKLYVYDDSAKRYATWELQSDKTWKPVKTVKMVNGKLEVLTADSPEVATVKRGSGVWLERQDTSKPIALVGQYEAVGATTAVAAGTPTLPSWNLIASPAISNWNLNAICEGVGVKDRIIVPTGKEPRIYTRDAGNAKWGYTAYEANAKGIVKPVRKEDDVEVAPGTGLWYISEGGAPVIKW